jgi:GntR family transcriptional regulator/MocR family aminotransferase
MLSPNPMGLPALREAITAYLAVSRGVTCIAEQIIVTYGYQDALNLVCDLVAVPGDEVWIEDPGYGFSRRALEARALKLDPIPIDDEGLRIDYGLTHAPGARLAVVTPAHQFPMGTTLSISRRHKLLAWAAQSGSWILEDDYDCEFHYSGYKPGALKALDVDDRVFYVGSFSKSILPSLRLGYIVVPRRLAAAAKERQELRNRGVFVLGQQAVTEFMNEGHFRNCEDDAAFAQRALRLGLRPSSLSGQTVQHDAGSGLLMCFTNVPEGKAEDIATRLRQAVQ